MEAKRGGTSKSDYEQLSPLVDDVMQHIETALRWDARTRELTSPRHALTLPRVQAILFDALWRADGAPVFERGAGRPPAASRCSIDHDSTNCRTS